MVTMTYITMKQIKENGKIYLEDELNIIYLTPSDPMTYHMNKWQYKTLPSINQWYADMEKQRILHKKQHSSHLSFTFPENQLLHSTWLEAIRNEGFQLGLLELYAIDSVTLKQFESNIQVDIEPVTSFNMEDYLSVYNEFSKPYGEAFTKESEERTREAILNQIDDVTRIVAYYLHKSVGILDVIVTDETVEIDGFGVLEDYRHKGIGTTMQSYVGHLAGSRPVILVADGDDTAKDMYIKQGYIFQSFQYQIVKEDAI